MRVLYLRPLWHKYKGLAPKWVPHLKEAIEAAGDEFVRIENHDKAVHGDVIISWNSRPSRYCIQKAPRNLVLEKGHLGHREKNLSYTFSDIGALGQPALPDFLHVGRGVEWSAGYKKPTFDDPPKKMVIMGQMPWDRSLVAFGFGGTGKKDRDHLGRASAYSDWMLCQARYWESKGMEVRIRLHPKVAAKKAKRDWMRGNGLKESSGSMEECLDWADAATAVSSTSLIEAFLAGLYVVPCHPLAMTWPVRSSWENWRRYDREHVAGWLDWVAGHQMTKGEFNLYWPEIKKNL